MQRVPAKSAGHGLSDTTTSASEGYGADFPEFEMQLQDSDFHLMQFLLQDGNDQSNGEKERHSWSGVGASTMAGFASQSIGARISLEGKDLLTKSDEVANDPLIQSHGILQQLLRSFRKEAFERMAFNSVLHRVLTFEAEVRGGEVGGKSEGKAPPWNLYVMNAWRRNARSMTIAPLLPPLGVFVQATLLAGPTQAHGVRHHVRGSAETLKS